MDIDTRTNATTPTIPQPITYQKPLFIHSSLASSIADIPGSSVTIPNRSMSVVSDRARKHYSDNLYNVLDNGMAARRSGRSTIGVCNPILESMASMQKMLITKQALRSYESNKKLKREVKFHLESVDENLDIADPFQNPGFSLNIKNPRVLEFKMDYFNGIDVDESLVRNFSKIDEGLELKFNNKSFMINLTEGEITKTIGSVSLMNQSYHVFDANGISMFQLEKRMNNQGQDQLVAIRKVEGQLGEMEMGRADLGGWKRLTLESEVVYGSVCSAKEKLMILAAVLVVMIKMTAKNVTRSEAANDACSVGGLWRNWMRKMRAIF